MNVRKHVTLVAMVAFLAFLGIGLMGCASMEKINVLEEQVKQATQKSDQALTEA